MLASASRSTTATSSNPAAHRAVVAPNRNIDPRTNRTRTTQPDAEHQCDDHRDGDSADLRDGIDGGDPLTARGRVKKRPREKDAFDPDDPDRYRYKAYHIRRAFDLFGHLPTIINDGIKRRAKEAAGEQASHIQSDRDYETFGLILNHLDGLDDDILRLKRNPKEFRSLVRKIREAADQARNNDTSNLKKDIPSMLTADGSSVLVTIAKGKKPSSKHDRGFENEVMGRHLCPISLDWDNVFVKQEIRDGEHAILACDWPRLLYADCKCDLDDLELGLGRNMALVRVVKYLFTGRSAAFSEAPGGKTTRSGNAALAGMKEVTPRVVAYAACMLRYAISNEESWSVIDKEFNMQEFYWHIVNIFDDSDDFGKDLLAWWNMKVFGTSIDTTMQPETSSAPEALSILKSQRQAKRAAKAILGDITNTPHDESSASYDASTEPSTHPSDTDTRFHASQPSEGDPQPRPNHPRSHQFPQDHQMAPNPRTSPVRSHRQPTSHMSQYPDIQQTQETRQSQSSSAIYSHPSPELTEVRSSHYTQPRAPFWTGASDLTGGTDALPHGPLSSASGVEAIVPPTRLQFSSSRQLAYVSSQTPSTQRGRAYTAMPSSCTLDTLAAVSLAER